MGEQIYHAHFGEDLNEWYLYMSGDSNVEKLIEQLEKETEKLDGEEED